MADIWAFLLMERVKEGCKDFIEERVNANKDLSLELYLICERYSINADRILTVSIPLILADCKLYVKGVTISYSGRTLGFFASLYEKQLLYLISPTRLEEDIDCFNMFQHVFVILA